MNIRNSHEISSWRHFCQKRKKNFFFSLCVQFVVSFYFEFIFSNLVNWWKTKSQVKLKVKSTNIIELGTKTFCSFYILWWKWLIWTEKLWIFYVKWEMFENKPQVSYFWENFVEKCIMINFLNSYAKISENHNGRISNNLEILYYNFFLENQLKVLSFKSFNFAHLRSFWLHNLLRSWFKDLLWLNSNNFVF